MDELVCIVCPKGCHLKIDRMDDNINITGNLCPRGVKYGIKELTNPSRILTTTVKLINGKCPRLPVISNKEIPKELLFTVMDELNKVVVKAPIKMGDVIIKNVLGIGVDILASRSLQ